MTKELLGHLNEIVGERISKDRDWPQTERKLTNHLKVAVTFLRRVGIAIAWEEKRTRRGRPISIRAVPPPKDSPTTSSPPSSDQENGESQNESNNLDGDDSANARHHQSSHEPPLSSHPAANAGDGRDARRPTTSPQSSPSNPLKTRASDGVDGGDGVVGISREKVCAQCGAEPDGTEQQCAVGDVTVWLHPDCQRPFLKNHQ